MKRDKVLDKEADSIYMCPWVKRARTLALATIWASDPRSRLRGGDAGEGPTRRLNGGRSPIAVAQDRSDVHDMYTYGTQEERRPQVLALCGSEDGPFGLEGKNFRHTV